MHPTTTTLLHYRFQDRHLRCFSLSLAQQLSQAKFEGLRFEIVHRAQAELVEQGRWQKAQGFVGIMVAAKAGLVLHEAEGVLSRHFDGVAAIIVA